VLCDVDAKYNEYSPNMTVKARDVTQKSPYYGRKEWETLDKTNNPVAIYQRTVQKL
jgi:hypothetical protein